MSKTTLSLTVLQRSHWALAVSAVVLYNTAESLVWRMDEHHIDKAIVASIHGILYKTSTTPMLNSPSRPNRIWNA